MQTYASEIGGPTKVHFRIVIGYGPRCEIEHKTGHHFYTKDEAIAFCTHDDYKPLRSRLVAEFRLATGTRKGTPYRWAVNQWTPVTIDGQPV